MKKITSIIIILFLNFIGPASANDIVDFEHHMQKIGQKLPYSELENTSVEFTLSDIKTRLKLVEKIVTKKIKFCGLK